MKTEAGTIIGTCAGLAVGLFLEVLIGAHWAPIGLMLAGVALGRALGVRLDRHYGRFTHQANPHGPPQPNQQQKPTRGPSGTNRKRKPQPTAQDESTQDCHRHGVRARADVP